MHHSPKLLNLVKNVGDLKFRTQNIITAKMTGTVLYKSHTLSKNDWFAEIGISEVLLGADTFVIVSFRHNTVVFASIGSAGFVSKPRIKKILMVTNIQRCRWIYRKENKRNCKGNLTSRSYKLCQLLIVPLLKIFLPILPPICPRGFGTGG